MIHRKVALAGVTAGLYLGGALALKAVEHAGLITHETTLRIFGVVTGVALAVYGNFLPKSLGTFHGPMSAMRMQSVLRVSGWAFTLGGAGYALASLLPVPDTVPLAVLGAATAYVLGYSAWAFMECAPRKDRPTA